MSLLFSELNKSDMICENYSQSNATISPNNSSMSYEPSSRLSNYPSKRSLLRDLNKTFKQQMWEVDACFRGVNAKYSDKKLI
jgi:hypothetical protein